MCLLNRFYASPESLSSSSVMKGVRLPFYLSGIKATKVMLASMYRPVGGVVTDHRSWYLSLVKNLDTEAVCGVVG